MLLSMPLVVDLFMSALSGHQQFMGIQPVAVGQCQGLMKAIARVQSHPFASRSESTRLDLFVCKHGRTLSIDARCFDIHDKALELWPALEFFSRDQDLQAASNFTFASVQEGDASVVYAPDHGLCSDSHWPGLILARLRNMCNPAVTNV
jgi:hypothetical protein